ncbi:transcription elongation factor GreA [Paenibacillus sp. S-38]|uniref:transcription elongation factor GreA n=1 Tax=Paenibacillus sp. S-38 TaxID=3416710 RepID=UPI003CEA5BFD
MANEEVILTREGFTKLEQELEELKTVKRKELATRLKTAISYGDLKENSEYHSAKDDQAFLETRILTLEQMLKKAKIADNIDTSKVNVGSVVVLYDVEFAEKIQYRIVGPSEADVLENRISYESPLGMSLMNRTVGDKISVNAPMGVITYELLEIRVD